MPTPELLAYRRVFHPSGSGGVTAVPLPDYAPGYETDDWFLMVSAGLADSFDFVYGGYPWEPGLGSGPFPFQVMQRFYNGDTTPWTVETASDNSYAALVYCFAFRNGGRSRLMRSGLALNYPVGADVGRGEYYRFCPGSSSDPPVPTDTDFIAVLVELTATYSGGHWTEGGSTGRTFTGTFGPSSWQGGVALEGPDGTTAAAVTEVIPAGTTFPAVSAPDIFPFMVGLTGKLESVIAAPPGVGGGEGGWFVVDYAPNPYVPPAGRVFVWDGADWVLCPVMVWDGSSWEEATVNVWDGGSWA